MYKTRRFGLCPGKYSKRRGNHAEIDVTKFIEQSGIRKARFGGYETLDVRQAMQALCTEYEQRLSRAEGHAARWPSRTPRSNSTARPWRPRTAAWLSRAPPWPETVKPTPVSAPNWIPRLSSLKEKNHSLSDQTRCSAEKRRPAKGKRIPQRTGRTGGGRLAFERPRPG